MGVSRSWARFPGFVDPAFRRCLARPDKGPAAEISHLRPPHGFRFGVFRCIHGVSGRFGSGRGRAS
eukprot:10332580-Lingulodinium_polyedra.AAC.1